jgi:hypothetical protein
VSEGDLAWAAIEPYWDAIRILESAEVALADFAQTPTPARDLFAAWWLQSEVCNGGFAQFFFNSAGVLGPEAAAAFRLLGMTETAALIDRAIARLGAPYKRELNERRAVLAALRCDFSGSRGDCPLDSLDDPFYALITTEAGGFHANADRIAETCK